MIDTDRASLLPCTGHHGLDGCEGDRETDTLVPVFGAGHCLLLAEGWRLAGHLVGRSQLGLCWVWSQGRGVCPALVRWTRCRLGSTSSSVPGVIPGTVPGFPACSGGAVGPWQGWRGTGSGGCRWCPGTGE